MKIISASRRTDIPAFYSKWFLNRIRAGFCQWIHPFAKQVFWVSLKPEDCAAIVFWTRNPKPLFPHLQFLQREGYRFYFHFTITGYPREIESHTPTMEKAVRTFRDLSQCLSPELLHWRYDPILLSSEMDPSYHLRRFGCLCRELEGYTHRCYFSFASLYRKTVHNLRRIEKNRSVSFQTAPLEKQLEMVSSMREIASSRGINLYACCCPELIGAGVEKAHCVGGDMVDRLYPGLGERFRSRPTRKGCGCVESTDIGAYDTCVYGCAYCYATHNRESAIRRMKSHDPADTLLWRPPWLSGANSAESLLR